MAVASMAMPGSTAGPTLGFDDYSLYSNLSDDELMQLAIERSLSETHDATAPGEASNTTTALGRRTGQYRANPPPTRLNPLNPPRQESSHRPPTAKPTDAEEDTIVKAILNGDVTTLRAMAKDTGNNILQPDKYGWIPLHEAAYYGQDQCVRVLLGAQPGMINKCDLKGQTALILAVGRERVACVEALLEKGADPELATKERETPLYKGADINSEASDGATALYEAAKNGHEDIVKLLLSQNADANKAGKKGLLPLHIAAQRGTDGKTLLTYDFYNYDKSVNIVSLLIKATSKSRVNRSGISPLHLAAECNRDEVLEVLIEAGYDVNAMLSEDRSKMYEDHRSTILYFAVANGNVEATTMLLEAGANPNLDTFNTLLVAVRQGSIELVTLLVEHGANVNAYVLTHPTSFPATVMFSMKYLSMLKYLMDNGCDAHSCFSCTYGSGPHPPIQETSERDDLRYNNDTRRNTGKAVQFCEIISTQAINRWAGPIIDVLLDYVGHVKLCSRLTEHLDSFGDWEAIKEKATPPRPLMQLCRLKIRQQVGLHRLRCINKLPLPPRVIKYLNHEERTQEEFCAF
ncbi:ankyrin repeat and SOCS box protein 2-like isoform X3 [Oncorhynchus nerka]|uniref:ankyrin repeat and SOCS box protein 2-like isoform X3 n=1 Tax=Oncorhynchus nerka TaxID=8023 RepID=UPI00113151B3|nr:ankyrin repeat and SOCS box protein 2-like isoform X3 [Oncorhynchus nerka]